MRVKHFKGKTCLLWIIRERLWITDFTVGETPKLHVHSDRTIDVHFEVWRRTKHYRILQRKQCGICLHVTSAAETVHKILTVKSYKCHRKKKHCSQSHIQFDSSTCTVRRTVNVTVDKSVICTQWLDVE